jgi:Protein of unknown function (DUF1565)
VSNTRPVAFAVFAMLFAHGHASAEPEAVGAPNHPFSISPAAHTVQLKGKLQFCASTSEAVSWEVNGISGGSAEVGTITRTGLYSAPAVLPKSRQLVITARSASDPKKSESALVNLASGAVYYVSTSGSDSAAGSQAAPWRTIQHAATTVKAGDTVNIRAGVYNEAVTPSVSGSAAAGSITFQSYSGETAVIDGTGLKVVNGQSGLITIANHDYITVSGLEIRNFTSTSDSQVPVGIYVSGADDHIQLLSNHVHNITTTAPANANNCASNALGIAIYGSSAPASINNLTISGNEVDHNKTGCSETVTLNGNVENFTVVGNLIHDNNNIGIDAIGYEGTSPQAAYDRARNGVISGNTVYNITSFGNPDYGNVYAADGIYVDGGTHIVIERNTVHDSDLNVELASEHKGKLTDYITLRNNLIYHGNSNGISIGGYDSQRGGTDHCTIVNNTLYANDTKATGSGEFQVQYYATNNVFKDNIVYAAASQDLFFNNYTNSESNPVDVDYNIYYSTDAADAQWIWNGKTYTGFAKYQTGAGKDAHSSFVNPQFLNLTTPNLDIASGSPAINTGVALGGSVNGTVDFAGNPRVVNGLISIGAYQQ